MIEDLVATKLVLAAPSEIDKIPARQAKDEPAEGSDRASEGWRNRAGVAFECRG
ncbi:MAG: hypothetical protein KGI92_11900 [Alphaproteobacteria bacterium]|nr:hypothetical protein [Alphaproteobacteria bacterium]MDE1969597.1 hypothetical protein [Alphaproteobacteria bacterium]